MKTKPRHSYTPVLEIDGTRYVLVVEDARVVFRKKDSYNQVEAEYGIQTSTTGHLSCSCPAGANGWPKCKHRTALLKLIGSLSQALKGQENPPPQREESKGVMIPPVRTIEHESDAVL